MSLPSFSLPNPFSVPSDAPLLPSDSSGKPLLSSRSKPSSTFPILYGLYLSASSMSALYLCKKCEYTITFHDILTSEIPLSLEKYIGYGYSFPMLELVSGEIIAEVATIARFVAEITGNELYGVVPREIKEKIGVFEWQGEIDSLLDWNSRVGYPAITQYVHARVYPKLYGMMDVESQTLLIAEGEKEVKKSLGFLCEKLKRHKVDDSEIYLLDCISCADIIIAATFVCIDDFLPLKEVQLLKRDFPMFWAWIDTVRNNFLWRDVFEYYLRFSVEWKDKNKII